MPCYQPLEFNAARPPVPLENTCHTLPSRLSWFSVKRRRISKSILLLRKPNLKIPKSSSVSKPISNAFGSHLLALFREHDIRQILTKENRNLTFLERSNPLFRMEFHHPRLHHQHHHHHHHPPQKPYRKREDWVIGLSGHITSIPDSANNLSETSLHEFQTIT